MAMARLMKLGGSVAVTIPAGILKEARFEKDMDVRIDVEDEAIVIRRAGKRRTIKDILAECDLASAPSEGLAAFDAAPPRGREIL